MMIRSTKGIARYENDKEEELLLGVGADDFEEELDELDDADADVVEDGTAIDVVV